MNNRDINDIQSLIQAIKSLENKNTDNTITIKKLANRITDIVKNTNH